MIWEYKIICTIKCLETKPHNIYTFSIEHLGQRLGRSFQIGEIEIVTYNLAAKSTFSGWVWSSKYVISNYQIFVRFLCDCEIHNTEEFGYVFALEEW